MVAYTQSATDALGLGDTNVSKAYGLGNKDPEALSDIVAVGAGTGKIQASADVLGITDVYSALKASDGFQVLLDSSSLSDGPVSEDTADSIADGMGVADALLMKANNAYLMQRSDPFTLTDSVSMQTTGLLARVYSDAFTVTDQVTLTSSNPNAKSLLDPMSLSDTAVRSLTAGPQAFTRVVNDRNNIIGSLAFGGTVIPPLPTTLRSNLAVNPSGEQDFDLNWVGSGGVVSSSAIATTAGADFLQSSTAIDSLTDSETDAPLESSGATGSTVTLTPYAGVSMVKYEVTDPNALAYRITPLGPNGTPHFGAFQINTTSRSIAFSARVASSAPGVVQARARLMTLVGTTLSDRGTVDLGSPVALDTTWNFVTGVTSIADSGATHWYLDLNFTTADGFTPSVGTIFAVDTMYVPGSGTILAGESYFDGSTPGAYWAGTPNDSISYYGTQIIIPPEDTGSTDGGTTGGNNTPDSETSPTETELPTNPPPIGETLPGQDPDAPIGEVLSPTEQAERILARVTAGGICLNEDVQIGDLVLNRLDENGVLWVVTDIEGWWTLPEPDIPEYTRGLADGSYQVRGRYSSRVITLSGSFFPSSPAQVRMARDKLVRSIDLCHRGAWFATHEPDATKASLVWLSGQPLISTTKASGRTDFSIGLKAPDPIKYGLQGRIAPGWKTVTLSSKTVDTTSIGRRYNRVYPWAYPTDSSGGVIATDATVVNDGNTRVFPIMTLRGPTAGRIVIQNLTTGQRMRVMKRLYAGDSLIIDCYNKQVSLNGTPNQRFYLDLLTDWIYADPGENQLFWYDEEASSSGSLTVQWRPGWIG